MLSLEQPSATFRPAVLLAGVASPRTGHMPFAADLISAVRPSMIVELGVSYGDSYFAFCQIVTEHSLACSCYGIDTWRAGRYAADKSTAYETVVRHNEAKYSTFSHVVRKSFVEALAQFSNDSIDILSVDGSQPYEALKRIFESWMPKVKTGGVILLSDIFTRGTDAGAWRLWEELQPVVANFSFRHNNGFGLLAKSVEAKNQPFLATLLQAAPEEQERIRRYYFLCAERLDLAGRLGASAALDSGYSLFQVFRSYSGFYETTPELTQVITPDTWINLHLDLPDGMGDRPLRLDVANRPAVVDIATIALRKSDGSLMWTWNPKDVTDMLRVDGTAARMPATDVCRILSLGNTPHVFLPEFRGAAFDHSLALEIRLRVDLELSAVREMNQNWADLDRAKNEFEKRKSVGGDTPNVAELEAAVLKAKSDAAKHLAQARIDHEAKIKHLSSDAESRIESMRVDLENQLAQQRAQLEEERRSHQVAVFERDQLAAQQPRMLQEISIAQGNVEELKAEVERLTTDIAHMEYDLTELRKLNARMAAALEEERSVRAGMQESSSWQLTKPFRAVGDLFGPRKKY